MHNSYTTTAKKLDPCDGSNEKHLNSVQEKKASQFFSKK